MTQPEFLAVTESCPPVAPAAPSVGQMMQTFIERGITEQNVAAFDKLMELHERLQARDAEKQFAVAFAALQAEMPPVIKRKGVPDKYGVIKYYFAPFEDVMGIVRPILIKHGFSVTFSLTFADNRMIQRCILQHIGGHSRENQFMVRVGSGPPGSSEAQGDGAAATFAKRYALCSALNIVCEDDNDASLDARQVGAPISKDKVVYVRELVKETKSDEAAFLKYAQVTRYEDIGELDYDRLVAALHKKQRA